MRLHAPKPNYADQPCISGSSERPIAQPFALASCMLHFGVLQMGLAVSKREYQVRLTQVVDGWQIHILYSDFLLLFWL